MYMIEKEFITEETETINNQEPTEQINDNKAVVSEESEETAKDLDTINE